ncbi:hypothetical protein TVAG_044360 [Trichomonas vaginalis G3]|uniref:Importin N-terminal domain-containing protein n=1 Tax=Trichomonas vaginalis (strain ATCC PRA-98 / G3) TaxID=412133 RepID=A2E0J4_TRIV3|nr:armadillo (ARM) repeat-containing protein family [Trichomonas vaginalis G3]EAY13874.1 hypothetical protein TVAG_044360 [Trichomonas vaginalis G3]KAI5520424.1 armadillo (ARM) repeat-containing protein family [Trichomonas vaginalis G3]|eukprot:XP_001326097.1 hypothetical protein [Trichomonas vaginalis G3]
MHKSFYECFRSISDNSLTQHTEEINEANAYLLQLKEEDPQTYVFNLIEIIETEEIQVKSRLNAIKMLSVPLKRVSGKIRRIPEGLDPQTFATPVFTTLIKYLSSTIPEMDAAAADSFIIFLNVVPIDFANAVIGELLSRITPQSPTKFVTRVLQVMSEANVTGFPLEIRIQMIENLIQIFSSLETNDDSIHYLLLTVERLIHYTDLHEASQEFLVAIINLVWNNAMDFPSESSKLFTSICFSLPEIFHLFPECYEKYMFVMTSSITMWPFLNLNLSFMLSDISNTILQENWQAILEFCIAILVSDNSTDPLDTDEIFTESNKILAAISMTEMIIENQFDNCYPLCMEYISNNIKSEEPQARFVCAVFSLKISEKLLDESRASEITDEIIETRNQILFELLDDDSPRVLQQALLEATFLIESEQLEPSNALFQFALTVLQSEKPALSDCSQQLLSAIANSGQEGAVELVSQQMLQIITESQQVELVSESFRVLTSIAATLDQQSALNLIEGILEYANAILNSNIPTISPCIGYLSQLIKSAQQSCDVYSDQINALAMALIENGCDDDGYLLLASMVDVFGQSVMPIIQDCLDIVINCIATANNNANLIAILRIVESVCGYIQDEKNLSIIVESCVEHLTTELFNTQAKLKIIPVLAKISNQNPGVIADHTQEILRSIKLVLPYIVNNYDSSMNFTFVLANAMPDNCEDIDLLNILLQQLRSVSRKATKFATDKKTLAMTILNLLQQKVPHKLSIAQFTMSSVLYANLEKIVGPENVEALHQILPKYQPEEPTE